MSEVTVTQADREAVLACRYDKSQCWVEGVPIGAFDDHRLIQAFARHRQSAEIAAMEAMKEACANLADDFWGDIATQRIRALSAHDIQKGMAR